MTEEPPVSGPLPYGPFTRQVRRFLQRLALLELKAEEGVVAEYRAAVATAEYQAAERVLGATIARSGREPERDALGGPLLQLVRADWNLRSATANGSTASTANTNAASTAKTSAEPMAAGGSMELRPIAEPALTALLALVMQDVLSAELFAQLYAPFEGAITRASLQQ